MADGDVKDYAGEKKKPSMALIISVGPKMPKKPEDTSKPDEAMKKAWNVMVESNGTYEISKNEGDMNAYAKQLMDLYQQRYGEPPPQAGAMTPDQHIAPPQPGTMDFNYGPPPPAGAMNPNEAENKMSLMEYYQKILPQHPDRRKPITKSFDILKIRSAAPPRKPNPVRMRRQVEPEPEPEMMPEPEEPEEDPEMKRRAMQAVIDKINSVRRQRDKFDEEQEVVPTSMEEMTDSLKDVDLSHFLKPPEER